MLRRTRRSVKMSSLLKVCRKCVCCALRLVAWIPVVFVALLLIWGYYVYVYIINLSGSFPNISSSPALSVFLVIIFLVSAHVIFCLQLASYVRAIITSHKVIPDQFMLSEDELEQLDQVIEEQVFLQELVSDLPVHQLSRGGGVRYCEICELIKPDRCHHCSVCNRVNNCVGFSNYKFFLLFLFYSVVLCLWLCITGLNAFITAWGADYKLKSSDKFQVIIWYFICSMFGLSTSVLLCFHVYLTLYNKTTLENMQPPSVAGSNSHRPFFITFRRNVQQVLGRNCFLAFLPVCSSEGNGVVYPIMRNQRATNEDAAFSSELENQPLAQTQI